MSVGHMLLRRAFGRPQGLLGRLGGRLMARMNAEAAASVIALLELAPGDHVLEIGFGPGVGIALAAAKAALVAGVDPSDEMLAQASARNAGEIQSGRVKLRQASAETLPFDDGAFDKAFAVNSLQLWSDRVAGLAELRRVLKPNGRAAFAFTPNSGQSKNGLIAAAAAAGFRAPRIVDAPGCFCLLAENG